MSRIRSIKPEWLDDELLSTASSDARALSVALICLSDDYGNGRAGRIQLAARVFPGKPLETLDDALVELVRIRYVHLYEVEGQRYFSIRTWEKNQRVDKPGQPKVPRPNPATIENDTERIALQNSQELPGNSRETPGKSSPRAIPSPPIPRSLPSSPDQPDKPGSARARGTQGFKPFQMFEGWEPSAEWVTAQAQKYEAQEQRVRALNPEFVTYWKGRGDRKTQRNWEATAAQNVRRAAKNGDLYVVPLGARQPERAAPSAPALTPEQRARVAQREADLKAQAKQREAELLGRTGDA